MSGKDTKVDINIVTDIEEEKHVTLHAVTKNPSYLAASDGPDLIITQVQTNSSHNYDEWEKLSECPYGLTEN